MTENLSATGDPYAAFCLLTKSDGTKLAVRIVTRRTKSAMAVDGHGFDVEDLPDFDSMWEKCHAKKPMELDL